MPYFLSLFYFPLTLALFDLCQWDMLLSGVQMVQRDVHPLLELA